MASASPASFARPPRPQQQQSDPENRDSMLRASILESALELGVGSSRTVANWIFNPVGEVLEEDESEGVVSPGLTSASTATSEESNLSAGLAQRSQPGAGILLNSKEMPLTLDTSIQYPQRNGLSPVGVTPDRSLLFDFRGPTPEPRAVSPASSTQPHSKNKLRKPRPDGYESDGGYVSEGGKSKKDKKEKEKKSKKKGKDKSKDGKADGGATDHESDGGHLSETALKKTKSKEKKDKSKKDKNADSPTTDYETDKGYSPSFSRSKSRKQSVTSPVSGDDSDGGYLSESSKKKRFFRLNSKSRKKQDSVDSSPNQPPPVPALPAMPTLPLPIHEKFSRSNTPLLSESRNATPIPGDTSSMRPSVDTFTTVDTTTSIDTSLTSDTSSTTVESDEKRDSAASVDGLTKAFRDAESVRSPSIDFLSAFRRPNDGSSPLSPSKLNVISHGDRPESPASPKSPVTALSGFKPVRSRPKISAPNTSALNIASKHVPVPLTLTPPTPTLSSHPAQPSPDPDYVLVTPNPSTVTPSNENRQSGSSAGSANGAPPSPTWQRPKVLAYYDLPPPSPPPRGPLPDVPSDISRSTSPSLSMMDSPSSRFPRSAPADPNDPRGLLHRPLASPIDRAHPLSREISRDVPTITHPVPHAQRGRVSPFPTAPVLPREQTAPLVRQTSKLTQEAVTRAAFKNGGPASAGPFANEHGRGPSNEQIGVGQGPASAQPYPSGESQWPARNQHLRVKWLPRSASTLDTQQPYETEAGPEAEEDREDERSWLVYDDDETGDFSDRSLSSPNTRPASTEPSEPSPDVNSILAGFRAQRDARLAARNHRKSSARDTLAGIVAGYERDTVYLDTDEGGDRSSVWSEANSRYSFLDGEKSAAIRAKFVKRVEAMYGKELVPPVPQLDQGLRG